MGLHMIVCEMYPNSNTLAPIVQMKILRQTFQSLAHCLLANKYVLETIQSMWHLLPPTQPLYNGASQRSQQKARLKMLQKERETK